MNRTAGRLHAPIASTQLAVALVTLLGRGIPVAAQTAPAASFDASAVIAESTRLASRDLWPGFEPSAIPAAIFDGESTWLFGHASSPAGFKPVSGADGVSRTSGRLGAVTANTSVEIGGVLTATLLPGDSSTSIRQRAATLLHEKFHVFQRTRHGTWTANEADLFTYPATDADLLSQRRLETQALRRALLSTDEARTRCLARLAMEIRVRRFAALGPSGTAYERGTELNEGLATYVERGAAGAPDSSALPVGPFAPDAVRQRGYRTGVAIALLLDRVAPDWKQRLEADDGASLDSLLRRVVGPSAEEQAGDAHGDDAGACAFSASEQAGARTAAVRDVEGLEKRRAAARRAFLSRDGWRVVIESAAAPLFPQGFDPLNVQVVQRGEVLHARYLKLGNQVDTLEVIGRASLTEGAGAHPLFNGVRRVTITGLDAEPKVVTSANGIVRLNADGLRATFRGARVLRSGRVVTIVVGG
ncbi:MAG TPA: hypothetical protein VFG84_02960 [Gemmatimonadaceae bacterium]|nr:hypothetical protein [Gemmatimonadaceae bacterium]